jgi:hypothetical protein
MPDLGRRAPLILAVIAGLVVLGGLIAARWIDRKTCKPDQTVATTAQLRGAIACARMRGGGNIKLAAGAELGGLSLRNAQFRQLKLVSADPARPARFTFIEIVRSSNIVLGHALVTGYRAREQKYAVYLQGADSVSLEGLHLQGIVATGGDFHGTAIMVRNSSNVRISRSSISRYTHAIALLNVSKARIDHNYFSDLRIDGVRGGKVARLRVERNVFTNFHPVDGDHPDAVQLWTRNEREASSDIDITGNIVIRGKGGATQGIFLRDTEGLPFRGVTIAGNILIGTMYAGIAVDGFKDLTIRDNVVIPLAPYLARIHIESGSNAAVSNNIAGKFLIETEATLAGNATLPLALER